MEYYKNNKDKISKQGIKYRIKNKDKIDKYHNDNKDKINKQRKKHRKEYPEVSRRNDRKKRARKNNIIETFSNEEWLQKLKNTFGVCPRCNKYVGIAHLTLDHKHPISKATQGQIYTIDDVQPLCLSCNSKKSNHIK